MSEELTPDPMEPYYGRDPHVVCRELAERVQTLLGLVDEQDERIAALEQALAEAKERRSEAERMGETWLRQRQPDKYGPTKPEGEE